MGSFFERQKIVSLPFRLRTFTNSQLYFVPFYGNGTRDCRRGEGWNRVQGGPWLKRKKEAGLCKKKGREFAKNMWNHKTHFRSRDCNSYFCTVPESRDSHHIPKFHSYEFLENYNAIFNIEVEIFFACMYFVKIIHKISRCLLSVWQYWPNVRNCGGN